MKIVVFSDSHHTTKYMEQAVLDERPDYLIHLGDHIRDAYVLQQQFQTIPMAAVLGNCDLFAPSEREQIVAFWGDVPMLLTHGHRYGVKEGLLRLSLAAREAGVRVALFGHTHRAFCECTDDLWLLNPGSCSGRAPTYGVIELQNKNVRCRIATVEV